MKFFFKKSDGGKDSPVIGYWLIEMKSLFSIVLLKFNKGCRENYHSHAFNAYTWFLWGELYEYTLTERDPKWFYINKYKRSLKPKYTSRNCFHLVEAKKTSYAISFRGPWAKTWKEYNEASDSYITLTSGRRVINIEKRRGLNGIPLEARQAIAEANGKYWDDIKSGSGKEQI